MAPCVFGPPPQRCPSGTVFHAEAVEDILLLLFVSNDNALVQRLDSNAKRGWLPLRNLRPLGPYDFLVKAFVDTGRPKLQKSSERPPSDILPLPQMEGWSFCLSHFWLSAPALLPQPFASRAKPTESPTGRVLAPELFP